MTTPATARPNRACQRDFRRRVRRLADIGPLSVRFGVSDAGLSVYLVAGRHEERLFVVDDPRTLDSIMRVVGKAGESEAVQARIKLLEAQAAEAMAAQEADADTPDADAGS